MRYLFILLIMSCASKHKPTETEQQLRHETNLEAIEMMEDEELFDDLPEAGEDKDEDEEE